MNKTPASVNDKWGKPIGEYGYFQFPLAILTFRKQLGISSTDVCVLISIFAHYWHKGDIPFPSLKRIAHRLGYSESTVRASVRKLRMKKLIFVEFTNGGSSRYHVAPLIKILETLIKEQGGSSYFSKKSVVKFNKRPYQDLDTKVDALIDTTHLDTKLDEVVDQNDPKGMSPAEASTSFGGEDNYGYESAKKISEEIKERSKSKYRGLNGH